MYCYSTHGTDAIIEQNEVTRFLRGPAGRQSHRSPILTNSIPWRQSLIVSGSPMIQNLDGSPGYGSYGHGTVNTIIIYLIAVTTCRLMLTNSVARYNVSSYVPSLHS